MQHVQEALTRDVYRIQVAFSVTDLVPYMASCTDLEFVVVLMPPRCATRWRAVANGSEDGFRVARNPLTDSG